MSPIRVCPECGLRFDSDELVVTVDADGIVGIACPNGCHLGHVGLSALLAIADVELETVAG